MDHPRVRGEDIPWRFSAAFLMGPSPRARGRLPRRLLRHAGAGTIPACAGKTAAARADTRRTGDHPRVRGEDDFPGVAKACPSGPSPRARGRRRFRPPPSTRTRTIPACAGKTGPATDHGLARGDHPRVRGEDFPQEHNAHPKVGPSPRARGRRQLRIRHLPNDGTIPACAGKTRRRGQGRQGSRDHPRVRGEDRHQPPCGAAHQGPSPRARGRLRDDEGANAGPGTIPACAGKTTHAPCSSPPSGDHPRVRGEDRWPSIPRTSHSGPSPRARGRHRQRESENRLPGTIPACAGKTLYPPRAAPRPRDHPRVRGEDSPGDDGRRLVRGPSPRARGRRHLPCLAIDCQGTIPACAGKTRCLAGRAEHHRDHPRVRGEDKASGTSPKANTGPSPRARGRLDPRPFGGADIGTIPACAGKTRSRRA